jgi:membrane protein required for colicin V production
MNIFDIIIGAILLFAMVRGFMKGFFAEVASLVAIVAGIFCAIHFSHHLEGFLSESTREWSSKTYKIMAFVITFLTVVISIIVIGKILTKLADITALGILNKILGGIFGGLKSAIILSLIFLIFDRLNSTIPFIDKETLDKSILYVPVKSIMPTLIPSILDKSNPSLKFFK